MKQLLVDSSVWIDLLKENNTDASLFLKNNFDNYLIVTCPTVVQEVLQGTGSDRAFNEVKSYFGDISKLNNNPYLLAVKAAELFRKLRRFGITIRKANDCLIAMYAIENDVPLLHDDKDFDFIATGSELQVIKL